MQIRCNSEDDWQSYGDKCYKVTGHGQKGSWKQAKWVMKLTLVDNNEKFSQFAVYVNCYKYIFS